ncbi:hypothetical protein HYS49_02430 [Candidatus Woesearchaeota archaeon]|nr:hypothetical protein [Candidatus Woesearchaeota archaeon]
MPLKQKDEHSVILPVIGILLLTAFLAGAQEETGEEAPAEPPAYDYADYNSYQNPDFYRDPDSDPAQWDWNQVNWVVFDFERADVYDVPEFYANLPAERYSDLNYRLVPDFELYIPDHSLIDGNKYVQDFGCVRCSLSQLAELWGFGEEYPLTYTTDGQIFHDLSGEYIFVGEFPARVSFLATLGGFEVRYPEGITEIDPPARGGWYTVIIEGRDLAYRENTVGGYLSFREGQPYVDNFDTLFINGIAITSYGETITDLYFDGLEHQGDYISIGGPLAQGGDRIIIESTSGNTEYSFLTGNDFFDVPLGEETDFFGMPLSEESRVAANALRFEPGAGATITIQDRSARNLIPEVLVFELGDRTRITTGLQEITFGETETHRASPIPKGFEPKQSTPFAAVFVLGTEEFSITKTVRHIFDAYNNFIIIEPGEIPQTEIECQNCPLDFKRNRVLHDYYSAQILANDISIIGETGNFPVLHNVLRTFQELPPAVRESIRSIIIVSDEEELESYCGENTGGCAFSETGTIIVPEYGIGEELFQHEGAHTLTKFIELDDQLNILEEQQEVQELIDRYGSLENVPQDVWVELVREAAARPDHFLPRWQRAVGGEQFYEEMRAYLGEPTVQGRWASTWRDGTYEPRFGCFTAYACNNKLEDIAVTAERTRAGETGGILVRELLDSTSTFYQERMGQEVGDTGIIMTPEVAEDWARRSRARVEAAHDEAFITQEDYERVQPQPAPLIIEPQEISQNDEKEVGAGEGP